MGITSQTHNGKKTGSCTPVRKFTLVSPATQAQNWVGKRSLPITKGSKHKSNIVSCTPNKSGVSCWFLLQCGVRVCVQYKDWKCILWCGQPKTTTKGGTIFDIIASETSQAIDKVITDTV